MIWVSSSDANKKNNESRINNQTTATDLATKQRLENNNKKCIESNKQKKNEQLDSKQKGARNKRINVMQMGGGGSCNIQRSCGLMRGQCKTQTRHNNKQAKETNRTICVRQKQKKTKRHKLHKHKQKYSSMLK